MKLANIFWIIGLGWMILSFIEGFIFIINGLYFEDWSFSRPLFKIGFRMFQINVNSKIDMDSGWRDSGSIFFSVKTTPANYKSRLDVLKTTWFQVVDRDKLSIVSDYLNDSYSDEKLFEAELIKEKFHLVLAKYLIRHGRRALCCKSGTEYKQFYDYMENHTDGQNQVKWYCHFDDDIYVNVKELSKLLAKYNSSKPYYIGRNPRGPGGVMVGPYRLGALKRNYHVNKTSYLYAAGAAYCNSLALMKELYRYFRSPKAFGDTCERTKTTDDLTVGSIIGMVLNHGLTDNRKMQSQAVSLKLLSTKNLTKMITLSYQTDRNNKKKIISVIDPKPRRFTILEDPTRFLTYHCLLYNETSWCQADSPGPPMVLENQLHNSNTSSDQTSQPATSPIQASDQTVSQPSKAPTTANDQDNSNKTPPNNQPHLHQPAKAPTVASAQDNSNKAPPNNQQSQNTVNDQAYPETTNNHDNPQRSDQPNLQQSQTNTMAVIQDHFHKTPPNSQPHLQNLSTSNDQTLKARTNHLHLQTSNQTLSRQSKALTTAGDQSHSNKTPPNNQAHLPSQEAVNDQAYSRATNNHDHSDLQRSNQSLQRSDQSDSQRLKENMVADENHLNEIHLNNQTHPQGLNTESKPTR